MMLLNEFDLMCIQTLLLYLLCLSPADEAHRRDVIRAAGPPQRAVEERGAGMPRRRRNLASMVANRRPQAEAVGPGKYTPING